MSAAGIADAVVKATKRTVRRGDRELCHADMVGHSADQPTIKAVETVDSCLARIEKAVRGQRRSYLITAITAMPKWMTSGHRRPAHRAHTNPCVIVIAENSKSSAEAERLPA